MLTVVVAVLLAVVGTAAVLVYVRQADNRALQGQRAVSVVVAQKAIPSGTSITAAVSAGLLTRKQFAASTVPSDAVSSITAGLGPLVTSTEIPAGVMLLRPELVVAAQVPGGIALPHGDQGVTMALCVPEAVAGNVQPGVQVAVYDTTASGGSLNSGAACSGSHQAGVPSKTHWVLNAKVISVGPATGQSTATTGASPSNATPVQGTVLVTLAVTNNFQAQQLITITTTGLPYLALLNP